ncbi:MAG: DEAD/DEAH box helicase family protein [Proteobacteria bacterium]|nr:DEAD/DEAH box helicase family protein [Pseudomonadota bacterium]
MNDIARQIATLKSRLIALDRERSEIAERLGVLEQAAQVDEAMQPIHTVARVTMASPTAAKIALFRSLFRGREDVLPRRWENLKTGKAGYAPVCRNEWVRGVCGKPQVKCGECPNQAFVPVGDDIIRSHLAGKASGNSADFTVGVYPMLPDETCWFLAADFDKKSWMPDVAAFRDTARAKGAPVAIERSRSGNGAHTWIFFAEPVPAIDARRLGALLVTATMDRYPDIGFDSYDRFFPSQDTMPVGGFGNLIALPLQNRPREKGNSVFLDDDFRPYEDQWAYLSKVERLSRRDLMSIVAEAATTGQIIGVRLPSTEEDDEPWAALPSRRSKELPIEGEHPASVEAVLGNQVYIDRSKLPPALVNRIVRLAAFQNPEFYAAQAMRLPTFGKPRIISCAELFSKHVALPRGCLDDLLGLLGDIGIAAELRDERQKGQPLGVRFLGELTPEQDEAAAAILRHETGVLAATTAFGKTVIAAKIVAARDRNTLVLVHRRQLLDQWVARLQVFLDIPPNKLGVIHGGKKKPSGNVDIALMQSLVRKGVVSDLVADYGHVIVDECHHLSAVGFEAIAREAKARYVLGLSATVTRKDGHHPIIFMQCGPIRHRVDAKKQAAARPFDHKVVFRRTEFRFARSNPDEKPAIQELYAKLTQDPARNDLIFNDILSALEAGRSPVVITERKDHLDILAARLSRFAKNVIVLRGGMSARQSRTATESLATIPDSEERVLVATGRYLGEGFDDARLDTLFLTMPISWRGILAQYSGRLHRLHAAKRDVVIYDYVDDNEPMLAKMAVKRAAGYRNLGYRAVQNVDHERPSSTRGHTAGT